MRRFALGVASSFGRTLPSSSPSVVPSRRAGTFSYVAPGPVVRREHELVFDESQREEVWLSDSLPHATPGLMSAPSHLPQTPSVGAASVAPSFARVMELKAAHPETFLAHAYRETLAEAYGSAIVDAEAGSSVAPVSAEEKARVASPAGALALAREASTAVAEMNRHCALAEANAMDADVLAAALSPEARAAVAASLHRGVVGAALRAARALSLANAAQTAALPAGQAAQATSDWLATIGISPTGVPTRSPRVPAELFATQDRPLSTPLSREERRNDNHILPRGVAKRLAMEHRDRAEVIPRRRLPTPLHADAPSEPLDHAARALAENRSLSDADRDYMLKLYADALAQKDHADPSRLTDPAEYKAWVAPQPQWGWYDPRFPTLQDDANEAHVGRGKFSRYRGSTYRQEQNRPETYGEQGLPGVAPGTPLETIEEAALTARSVEQRMKAEVDAASASVSAALERAMGLPSRKPKAQGAGAGPSFFKRLAAGQVQPAAPQPPATGTRVVYQRVEEGLGGVAAAMGAGVKAASKGAGGKGGAAAGKGAKPGAAPAGKAGGKK